VTDHSRCRHVLCTDSICRFRGHSELYEGTVRCRTALQVTSCHASIWQYTELWEWSNRREKSCKRCVLRRGTKSVAQPTVHLGPIKIAKSEFWVRASLASELLFRRNWAAGEKQQCNSDVTGPTCDVRVALLNSCVRILPWSRAVWGGSTGI